MRRMNLLSVCVHERKTNSVQCTTKPLKNGRNCEQKLTVKERAMSSLSGAIRTAQARSESEDLSEEEGLGSC
jgi:hypothetical protein